MPEIAHYKLDPVEAFAKKFRSGRARLRIAPIKNFLKRYQLAKLGGGSQVIVYKLLETGWVLKEGTLHYSVPLSPKLVFTIPRALMFFLASIIPLGILPRRQELLQHFRFAKKLKQYLGSAKQKKLRKAFWRDLPELLAEYDLPNYVSSYIEQIPPETWRHDFLVRDYLLLGYPLQQQEESQFTYFVLQPELHGSTLQSLNWQKLSVSIQQQLVLFSLLNLYMFRNTGFLADVSGRYLADYEKWIMGTENLLVTEEGLKLIDTNYTAPNLNFYLSGLQKMLAKLA